MRSSGKPTLEFKNQCQEDLGFCSHPSRSRLACARRARAKLRVSNPVNGPLKAVELLTAPLALYRVGVIPRRCYQRRDWHAARDTIQLRLHAPSDLGKFRLPTGVQRRLNELLDRQDQGQALTAAERREADGLVELAVMLSLLKAQGVARDPCRGMN